MLNPSLVLVAACSVACLVACSTYDEATPPAGPASDAATNDATALDGSADATDGGALPAGLISNGGFESSTGATCAPGWAPGNSVATVDTTARTGSRSCKVCNNGSGDAFAIVAVLPYQPGQWVLTAHLRQPPAGTTAAGARVDIAYRTSDGVYAGGKRSDSSLGSDWTPAQASATSNDMTIATVAFEIGGTGPNGACVLVDDVSVEHF